MRESIFWEDKFIFSPFLRISSGVFLEVFPFPPVTEILGMFIDLRTPHKTVVVPEECQSYPSKQANPWNQRGSAIFFKIQSGGCSSLKMANIWDANSAMREVSQEGAFPWWRGRSVVERIDILNPVLSKVLFKAFHDLVISVYLSLYWILL